MKLVSLAALAVAWLNRFADDYLVNGGFDRACGRVRGAGGALARLQTGQVQHYLRVLGLARRGVASTTAALAAHQTIK